MLRMYRISLGFLVVATLLGMGATASAQRHRRGRGEGQAAAPAAPTAEQVAAARAAYGRGQELFRGGSYPEAEAQFVAAFQAVPNPVVLLSIAECQERQNHVADAVASLERYLEMRADAPDRASVEQRLGVLRARPSTVIVSSSPSGAAISIDGQATSRTTPAEIQIAPGEHTIVATLPGRETSTQTVRVQLGSREQVTLALAPSAGDAQDSGDATLRDDMADAESETEQSDADQSTAPSHGPSAMTWVAGGIGAAGLVAGTVFGFLALSAQSDFNSNPTTDTKNRGESYALLADIGFGVAIVGVATALVFYLTSGSDSADVDSSAAAARAPRRATARRAWSVAPVLGRDGAGVAAGLAF